MYAVKVGWVGQTFALAKSNESGGKRSRIRRSKEERKALVESFIKRYQNDNSGSFPSLNLTHKEVGGSFYTVREIVREIIQDNRVLGPAKPFENEQEVDHFHEQYPLGSISMECQSHVSLSSDEAHVVSSNHHIIEELDITLNGKTDVVVNSSHINEELDSDGKADGQKLQRLVSEQYINLIALENEYKVADRSSVQANHDMLHTDIQIDHDLGSMEDIMKISTPKVTPTAIDVVVETFPVCSASGTSQEMDVKSVKAGKLTVNLEQQEVERVEVAYKLGDSAYCSPLEEKSVENHSDQLFETLSSSTTEGSVSTPESKNLQTDVSVKEYPSLQTTKDSVIAGIVSEPTLKSTDDKNSNEGDSLSQELAANKTKRETQNALTVEETKNSTLNRTRLESWEESSRSSKERNPVLAAVKAFISAFVKFWTEE